MSRRGRIVWGGRPALPQQTLNVSPLWILMAIHATKALIPREGPGIRFGRNQNLFSFSGNSRAHERLLLPIYMWIR